MNDYMVEDAYEWACETCEVSVGTGPCEQAEYGDIIECGECGGTYARQEVEG